MKTSDMAQPGRAPWYARMLPVATFAVTAIVLDAFLRLFLAFAQVREHGLSPWKLPEIFGLGALSDLFGAALLSAAFAVFLLAAPRRVLRWRATQWVYYAAFAVGVFLVLLQEVSDWFFWQEFSARPNFIAVDYLVYTTEVVDNIRESYPVVAILAALGLLALALTWAQRGRLARSWNRAHGAGPGVRPIALCVALVWAALHVEVDRLLGADARVERELAKNGTQSFVQAFSTSTLEYAAFYRTVDEAEARARLRDLLRQRGGELVDDGVARRVETGKPPQRRNVVLICVESLSAAFLGAYGAEPSLTPRLDELAGSSVVFDEVYATGTRTVRGLEALTLSLPPTPGRSVVKRPGCENKSSLGWVLRERGYDANFLYGGYAYFDNMLEFFSGNGFDVVDRWKLEDDEVTFANAWGVCDGDILERALEESDRSFERGHPFFQFVMTTSNHRPFTYPPTAGLPPPERRGNAVRYTDAAIGAFLDAARTRPWYDDTIFVVVADHCASSAGKVEVDVSKYRVPLIIHAPAVLAPRHVRGAVSQIDVAPTLMGLLGGAYTAKFFGRDALDPAPTARWAPLGNYQSLGLLHGSELVLLLPRERVLAYRVGPGGQEPLPAAPEPLLTDAVAIYQTTSAMLAKAELDRCAPSALP